MLLLLSFLTQKSWATYTEQRGSSWNKIFLAGKFSKNSKWHYLLENDLRLFLRDQHYFDQDIPRLGIGYQWLPKVSLWAGYDYIFKKPREETIHEQRRWEQILIKIPFYHKNHLFSRSRLEQRSEENQPDLSWRFRQQLNLEIPFETKFPVIGIIYDEMFFNLNHPEWVSTQTLDQNRIFLGIRFPFFPKTQLTVGYLNQSIWRDSRDTMNHILYTILGIQIN